MAKIEAIFKKELKSAETHPKRVTKWIHYTKLYDNKDQYCNERGREELLALADLIEADGEVLQDLLVRKSGPDEYEIIAGHKRCRACRILVEERGDERFALLPCFVKEVSDVRAEFQLYSSNGYHEKSDYERMHELERIKYLLENYPEEFPQVQKGRMVERLAKLLNMKKTTVGEYLTISKNLGEPAMEKFQSGELKKSAAVQMATLPQTEQNVLVKEGKTSLSQVMEHKEKNVQKKEVRTGAEKAAVSILDRKSEDMEKENISGQLKIVDSDCRIEEETENPETAPDNPLHLKNKKERENFINSYHKWDIWCKNEFTEETFYRYDLPDGSAVIVKEYPYLDYWDQTKERIGTSLYLILPKMIHFKNAESSMTMILEHLKDLKKGCCDGM